MFNTKENYDRDRKLEEKALIGRLNHIIPDKSYIIFNTNYAQGGNIPFMFYSDYMAYRCIPTVDECKLLKSKGYNIAIIDFNDLPDYIKNDSEIIKIKANMSRGNK